MRTVDVDCNREDSPAGGAHTRSINRKERNEHRAGRSQSKTWSQKDENSFVSLTPCFSWVKKWPEQQQPFQRFPHAAETVETVPTSSCSASTQLKQGVNETLINQFTHTSTN